jgi:hypothetical protein
LDPFLQGLDFDQQEALLILPAISYILHDGAFLLVDLLGTASVGFEIIPLSFPGFANQGILLGQALDKVYGSLLGSSSICRHRPGNRVTQTDDGAQGRRKLGGANRSGW